MNLFSTAQLTRFWVIYVLSASLPFMLQPLLRYADYQGWLSFLGGYILSLFLAYFAVALVRSSKGQDFIQAGQKIVGKPVHKIILVLVIFYTLLLNIATLLDFSEFMGFIYLEETPNTVISIIFITCAAIAAYSGLRTIVYMSDGFFILLILSIILTTPIFLKNIDPASSIALIKNFELPKLFFSSFYVTNWTSDFIIALFFLSSFQTKEKTMKAFALAQMIVLGVMLLYWYLILLLFGPHLGSRLRYPILDLLRFFEIGEFLENADPLIVSIWASVLLIRSALLLYIGSKILASFFRVKKQSKKIIPFLVGLIVWVFTTVLANYPAEYYYFIRHPISNILMTIKCIPIFYFVIYKLRWRKKSLTG